MAASKIFTRDFTLSFFAQFAFTSVFCILLPTLPIYLSKLGSTESEIGVLIGVFSLSSLILRPFVGRALLRIPEKKFMLVGSLLYASSSVLYLVAPPFWPLFILRVLQGVGLALFATSSFTLVTNIVPESHRGQSLGYFYLSINFAFVLAPSFGMFLINHFNFTILFFCCAALSLCALFITTKLRKKDIDPSKTSSMGNQPFICREALPAAIIAFMVNIIWGAMAAFFPLYALTQGVTNPGFFFATFAITLIVGRGLGGKILDLYPRERIILPCLISQIIAMILLPLSATLPMFILAAVIWGIGMAFLYPTLVAYALDGAGDARGPAMGTFTAVADLGSGMGSAIMGIIVQLTNYPIMFVSLALTGLINLSYFHFMARKRKRNPYANL